jgi:hypothetical protein
MEVPMADVKVRCEGCGAKNADALSDRCRICGALLPDAQARRAAQVGATSGPAFSELVETEVNAWRDYSEARSRSRRPAGGDADGAAGASRTAVLAVVAAAVGALLLYLAWVALIA